jgi:RNA polymerase sigma-70 factor (ECF subfamily)
VTSADDPAHRTVEAVARACYGKLVAFLSSRTRDVTSAEDALSDALIAALTAWPHTGIPRNPQGWLIATARNRLIDHARHDQVHALSIPTLELIAQDADPVEDEQVFPDERLKLLFVCAHPAIDADMHTPLMLQTVLGLDASEIGRAFLVSPQAMSQRLVRAKTKIRRTAIAFEVPEAQHLPQRMEAVMHAIYAAYGSGWEDADGVDPRGKGLTEEAIWLARLLCDRMPDEPEVKGLLALMLHCEARRPARRDADGRFIPLSEQDPGRWNRTMIEEAERILTTAADQRREPGRFQLEAAIQSVHAERARSGVTQCPVIALFYDRLVELSPTLGARVACAAARAEVEGATTGLSLLDAIDHDAVVAYQPYWVVRAHLLQQLRHDDAAADAFDRAIGLSEDPAVRRFLLERRNDPALWAAPGEPGNL